MEIEEIDGTFCAFPRTVDGDLHVVMAASVDPSLRSRYPYAITFLIRYAPSPNGLPTMPELNRLNNIEDKLGAALTSPQVIHVGHVTGAARCKIVFYSAAEIVGPITVKTSFLKKETFQAECRHDPNWTIYEAELEPTLMERETALNEPVLEKLEEHGDDLTKARKVDFAAHFPNPGQRAEFVAYMNAEGFSAGEQGSWEPEPGDYWCDFTKQMPVDLESICLVTGTLRKKAAELGGEFDGWGCPLA